MLGDLSNGLLFIYWLIEFYSFNIFKQELFFRKISWLWLRYGEPDSWQLRGCLCMASCFVLISFRLKWNRNWKICSQIIIIRSLKFSYFFTKGILKFETKYTLNKIRCVTDIIYLYNDIYIKPPFLKNLLVSTLNGPLLFLIFYNRSSSIKLANETLTYPGSDYREPGNKITSN